MNKRLQKFNSIKLHYKNGKARLEFYDEMFDEVLHFYEKDVDGFYEVFTLYKKYQDFINKYGWSLVMEYLANIYGVSSESKPVKQVINEVSVIQQRLLKEMDRNV